MGAFHQPDAADDEDHTDHHIRQAGHDEIEGAENGGGVAPAVDEVAENVHDEVLVGDERKQEYYKFVLNGIKKSLPEKDEKEFDQDDLAEMLAYFPEGDYLGMLVHVLEKSMYNQ